MVVLARGGQGGKPILVPVQQLKLVAAYAWGWYSFSRMKWEKDELLWLLTHDKNNNLFGYTGTTQSISLKLSFLELCTISISKSFFFQKNTNVIIRIVEDTLRRASPYRFYTTPTNNVKLKFGRPWHLVFAMFLKMNKCGVVFIIFLNNFLSLTLVRIREMPGDIQFI